MTQPPTRSPLPPSSSARRPGLSVRKLSALWAVAIAAALGVGCTSAAPPTPDEEPETAAKPAPDASPPQPGAAGWSGHALQLPADSPIVTTVRPDALLRNARALRGWLLDDADMFGPEGSTIVERQEMFWRMLEARMGTDPFSEEAPRKFGLDVTRPIYLGMYPASAGGGSEFVDTVDTTLTRELELDEDESLSEGLEALFSEDREVPKGLHSRLLEKVNTHQPHMGFRLVVPLQHPHDFLTRIARLSDALEYERIGSTPADADDSDSAEDPELPVERLYYDVDSQWPAFMIRVGDTSAKLDFLFREFRPRGTALNRSDATAKEELEESVRTLISTFGAGRPAAPRPEGAPVISVAADQAASARLARLEGYKKVLQRLRNSAVSRRDRQLAVGMARATTIAETWERASDRLSGVTYGLVGKKPGSEGDYLFKLDMTLFGTEAGPTPPTDAPGAGLAVTDRGFSVSMALAPLIGSEWKEWVGLEDPSDLVGHAEAADSIPILYALSLPRNLALFLVNAEEMIRDEFPDALESLYQLRDHVRRVELATSGTAPGALRLDPKLVGLLALDPDADEAERRAVLDAVGTAWAEMVTSLESGPGDAEDREDGGDGRDPRDANGESDSKTAPAEQTAELTTDTIEPMPLGGGNRSEDTHYFAKLTGSTPYVMVALGLDDEEIQKETQNVGPAPDRPEDLFYLRLEPATLTATVTAFEPRSLEPLDLGVLAQRVGALILSVRPQFDGDVRRLRYRLELRRPPEL